jgi:NAD-specific glutamate dehydrogenase
MKKIEQLLAMHLLKDIPAVSQQDRSDIVRFMLGQPVRRSMDALTTSLAKSSVELGSTLSAVLRCQWLNIQQLMKEINPGNIHGKLHAFSQCVAHFSELQASIVAAFERNWHTLLDKEIFERVMAQCRLQWASEKAVRLHNYFHEMPVTATASYIDSSGTHLHIKASEEVGRVFSCKPDMQNAWIPCSDKKYVLQVSMKLSAPGWM